MPTILSSSKSNNNISSGSQVTLIFLQFSSHFYFSFIVTVNKNSCILKLQLIKKLNFTKVPTTENTTYVLKQYNIPLWNFN